MVIPPFRNDPGTDFSDPEGLADFRAALERVRSRLGEPYPLWIGGQARSKAETFASVNPAHPDQVVGIHSAADTDDADAAVAAAAAAFAGWSQLGVEDRAAVLLRAAALVRRRRHELSALMALEVGKPWDEADGETAEVIDLLEWYARHALSLGGNEDVTPITDEILTFRYLPLGVGVIISPWNFPIALLAGMTSAALVTGNTVVVKPASAAVASAQLLVRILHEAGLPDGVLNLIPGRGDVIGDRLIDNPAVRFIAFTGSRDVGVRIYARAAVVQRGQRWLKRVQLEMGGKNAVVVDEDADPEAAARAIVTSAFGFQGQKCSAGSRAILVRDVYDEVADRVVAEASRLRLGDPADPETQVGPVIDASAESKILGYVEVGRSEGRLLVGGRKVESPGHFIEPTVFGEVDTNARIAQEEIFGPVLSLIRARDIDHALAIANGTDYGLTGSYFGRDPIRIAKAKSLFHAGNLYINRKSTGALMGAHPFGGFNMSGTDTKAGGPDYLHFFVQAQAIGERLQR